MKKDAIYVFAGYQFKSDHYTKDDWEGAIKEAIKTVENKLQQEYHGISLEYIGQEIEPFKRVDNEIINKIKRSDICIFELSHKNLNVYFEMGYSLGITISKYVKEGRSIITVQHEDIKHTEIASDLLGIFLLKYKDHVDLEKKMIRPISQKINDLFRDKKFLNRLLWGIYNEKVNIICSHIPIGSPGGWGTRLGERGDFNTVYELSILLSGILECDVKYYTTKEAEPIEDELFKDHIIIVGGPCYNKYSEEISEKYAIPFKYEWYPEEDKKDFLCDEVNKRKYGLKEKMERNKKYITKDFGIFAKLPSIYNEEKNIILISGIETFGTLGAARAFTHDPLFEKNSKVVLKKVGIPSYFATIVESEISYNLFPYPAQISKEKTAIYDPNTKMWVIHD